MTAPDLAALLPILDAVAAGAGDEGRVERWAAAFDKLAQGRRNDLHVIIADPRALAYAAIALADAEAMMRLGDEIDRQGAEITARANARRQEFEAAKRGPTKRFEL